MKLGLDGIAKGYAVDRAVQILRQAGLQDFAVNAGGDLYVSGRRDQQLWRVGIQSPRQRGKLAAVLPAGNVAVATSGDYERFFMHSGVRYHHIIDPRTGYPASRRQSVTVLASRTYWADALATGIFVLGVKEGLKLANSLADAEALIIDNQGRLHFSDGINASEVKHVH